MLQCGQHSSQRGLWGALGFPEGCPGHFPGTDGRLAGICPLLVEEVGQRHLYPDEIILIREILGVRYDDIFEL